MAEMVPCSFCGKSIPSDSKFCPFCGKGHSVASPQIAGVPTPGQPSPGGSLPNANILPQIQDGQSLTDGAIGWMKRNKILVIVLAVLGLILACCICSNLLPFLQSYS
jgi:hypothetical protein